MRFANQKDMKLILLEQTRKTFQKEELSTRLVASVGLLDMKNSSKASQWCGAFLTLW